MNMNYYFIIFLAGGYNNNNNGNNGNNGQSSYGPAIPPTGEIISDTFKQAMRQSII